MCSRTNIEEKIVIIDDEEELTTRQLFRNIGPFLWPDSATQGSARIKFSLIKTILLIISAKGLSLAIPIFWKDLIDLLTDIDKSDAAATAETLALMSSPFAAYAAIKLLEPTIDQYKSYTFSKVKQSTTRKIGRGLVEKLFGLDHAFHTNRETGAILKAVDRGNRAIATVLHALCIVFLPALFQVICTGGFIWYFCGPLYAVALFIASVIYATFSIKYTEYRTPFRIAMNKADMEAGNLATDSLLNYETVKFFANEKYETERYDQKLAAFEEQALKTDRTLALLNMGQLAILGACLLVNLAMAAGVIDFGQNSIANGKLTIGEFVMIASYFQQIQRPLFFLGSTYRDLIQAKTDFETMWRLMEQNPELEEGSKSLLVEKELDIKFKDVRFAYGNGNMILNGVNFGIAPGERVAIVGGSGAGKSTLAKLLFRFYDPLEGSVEVNGEDIRNFNLKSFRETIGVVPQDCVLFNDTIYNNIRYGNLNATENQIIEAAKVADLHRSVAEMKQGYQTVVGERGVKLSGGEKQRLAIARCFLKDPKIVIYDEATSSLDSVTEQRILESLDKATKNKSLLVIAHRLSTIVKSDKIIVLKDGKVAEIGTHFDLFVLNNHYRKMWDIQSNQKDTMKKKDTEKTKCRKSIERSLEKRGCCAKC